jgi:hypothetical protein
MSDVSRKDASLKGAALKISAKESQVGLMGLILGWMCGEPCHPNDIQM